MINCMLVIAICTMIFGLYIFSKGGTLSLSLLFTTWWLLAERQNMIVKNEWKKMEEEANNFIKDLENGR